MASLPEQHIRDKPIFHVAPPSGWANDPNGPLLWGGRYHLFYQHLPAQVQWGWGLCWGHVSSTDMVTWQHHPPALCPTPGGPDADGCFSGCAVVLHGRIASSTAAQHAEGPGAQEAAAAPASSDHRQLLSNTTAQAAAEAGSMHCDTPPLDASNTPGTDYSSSTEPGNGGSTSKQGGTPGVMEAERVSTAAAAAVASGVPVLLYTGVVRRPDAPPGVRPSSLAVSELCYEQQLAAVAADPGDACLIKWVKCERPVLRETPPGLCLNCFRDPFILERPSPSNGNKWLVMVGAGIRDRGTGLACAGAPPAADSSKHSQCADAAAALAAAGAAGAGAATTAAAAGARRAARGAALVYSSDNLLTGWQYKGPLCVARSPDLDGPVWECPLLLELNPLPLPTPQHDQQPALQPDPPSSCTSAGTVLPSSRNAFGVPYSSADRTIDPQHAHLFSASVGTFPSVYWMGRYMQGRFDLDNAAGPSPLDLGDVLYAPNVLTDKQGRTILWAWLCELPRPATHSQVYAGSMCLPRLIGRGPGGMLYQQPLPLLQQLSTQPTWQEDRLLLGPGEVRHVGADVPSSYFSLTLTLQPAGGAAAAGVAGFMLPTYHHTATAASPGIEDGAAAVESVGQGVVVVYDFSTCQLSASVGPGVGQDLLLPLQAESSTSKTSEAVTAALAQYLHSSSNSSGHSSISNAGAGAALSSVRRLGGKLRSNPGEGITLQVFLDYSILEVFTGDGQVLSTRVYRSSSSSHADSMQQAGAAAGHDHSSLESRGGDGVEPEVVPGGVWLLVGAGGQVEVKDVKMAAMGSIWQEGGGHDTDV